jgi:transketolase
MRKQFKNTVTELAARDERIVLVFGDISVFLFNDFQKAHPDRFYNMGICEQALVSVAAGLSSQGLVPFVHSIAPFITERALEQIKLDCSYNQFPVNIVSCGATFDYAWDGATHHAWTDLAFLRVIPNVEIFQPGNDQEIDRLLRWHYDDGKTSYFRLSDHPHSGKFEIERERGVVVRDCGSSLTVVTAGPILENVLKAAEGLPINILYFHTLKPFDHGLIRRFAHTRLKVVHDSFGLFEAVCETAGVSVARLGLPDHWCCSYGTVEDVRRMAGLDVDAVRKFLQAEA